MHDVRTFSEMLKEKNQYVSVKNKAFVVCYCSVGTSS